MQNLKKVSKWYIHIEIYVYGIGQGVMSSSIGIKSIAKSRVLHHKNRKVFNEL